LQNHPDLIIQNVVPAGGRFTPRPPLMLLPVQDVPRRFVYPLMVSAELPALAEARSWIVALRNAVNMVKSDFEKDRT